MGRRLLIIADDPMVCEVLKDRLEAMGYAVLVANDGRTGLALMALGSKHAPIGGVLLDMHMPVMDGLQVLRELRARHGPLPGGDDDGRSRIERDGETLRVIGGDVTGAMYGGLDIAEALRTGMLDSLKDSDHTPHIARRGIKFNIPLDLRTPSYTDCSDAAQANIPEMWEREFWTAFLDSMARHRYNVLSLWSLHPFPSLVKVPEFPEVALDDVWRTRVKLDDTFSFAGNDMVRPAMLADHEVVKRMTIHEKIEFWRWVMQRTRFHSASIRKRRMWSGQR